MNNFIQKAKNLGDIVKKNLTKEKPEVSVSEAFDEMDRELAEAEKAIGGNFFPTENGISINPKYLEVFGLKLGAKFEEIEEKYKKLSYKYDPKRYEDDERKHAIATKKTQKIEEAFNYLKEKYNR